MGSTECLKKIETLYIVNCILSLKRTAHSYRMPVVRWCQDYTTY